jgi:hypothetical protein
MEALGLKAIAALVLLVQALTCLAPAGTSLCIAPDACPVWGTPAAATVQPVASRCCTGCHEDAQPTQTSTERDQFPLPRPIPSDRECPQDCDCCVDLAVQRSEAVFEFVAAAKSGKHYAAPILALPAAADCGELLVTKPLCLGLPPPDRPRPDWAEALRITRLLV